VLLQSALSWNIDQYDRILICVLKHPIIYFPGEEVAVKLFLVVDFHSARELGHGNNNRQSELTH